MATPQAQAELVQSDPAPLLRIGYLFHDLDGFGGSEDGADIALEFRAAPPSGPFWRSVYSPRPHIGANINPHGDTSSLYAGFTWSADIGSYLYVSFDLGGAVHNGKRKSMEPDRASLGSRLLFREALEIGIRLGDDWRIGVRFDHISNAQLTSENDGITDLGLMASRRF